MTIWMTADQHFGHFNILKYASRPFASIQEHDEILITNYNLVVQPGDTCYMLGDFSLRDPEPIYKRLNGRKVLIFGNHDQRWRKELTTLFDAVHEVLLIGLTVRGKNERFWLSHYAHRTWPHRHHGAFHCYAHSHGKLPNFARSMDVGVDCHNYRPISVVDVVKKLEGQPLTGGGGDDDD